MHETKSNTNAWTPGRRQVLTGLAAGASLGFAPLAARAQSCPIGQTYNPYGFRVFRNGNPPRNNTQSVINNYSFWPVTDCGSMESGSVTSTWTTSGSTNNWPINAWFYVWANRMVPPGQNVIGPNPMQSPTFTLANGYECRTNYSTIALANAATQSQIRYWLGRKDYLQPWQTATAAANKPALVYTYQQLLNSAQTYPTNNPIFNTIFSINNAHLVQTFNVMTDVLWLPSAPPTSANPTGAYWTWPGQYATPTQNNPNGYYQRPYMMTGSAMYAAAPGIILDYECGDGRTAAQTTAFLAAISADLGGGPNGPGYIDMFGQTQKAQLVLWTDPLNGPTMATKTGLDATNLPTILNNYVDLMSVQIYGGCQEGNVAASYVNQIGLLKGGAINGVCNDPVPYHKLFLIYDLGKTTANDAAFTFELLSGHGPTPAPGAGVWFWPDYSTACSTTTNALMTGVLQGNTATPTSIAGYTGSPPLTPCYSNLP